MKNRRRERKRCSGEEEGGLLEGGVAQGQTEKPKDGVTEEGPRPS